MSPEECARIMLKQMSKSGSVFYENIAYNALVGLPGFSRDIFEQAITVLLHNNYIRHSGTHMRPSYTITEDGRIFLQK